MKQNILITGFMGAGKSSVARALAELTGLFAVDTDDLIESLLHCSIKNYFVRSMIAKAKREPKFSTRQHSRCTRCGRPHGYYRKFGLCRICLRELANKGELPGVTKASWKAGTERFGWAPVQALGLRARTNRTTRFITD